MKKILFVVAVATTLFSACKNDDIEITEVQTPEPTKTLTMKIATSATFEPFGINEYQTKLLNKDEPYEVGLFTYIYDEQGLCVDSIKTHEKKFSQVEHVFSDLERGKYTVVTIETLVNSDLEYASDYWNIINSNQLKTLAIVDNGENPIVFWGGVVGFSSVEIDLTTDQTESISPQAIGSLVDVSYYHFDKSPYNFVAFNTKDRADGILLDPSLGNSERFIGEYIKEHTWSFRDFCITEQVDAKFEEILSHTVYILEEGRIQWCFGPQTYSYDNDKFELSGWSINYPSYNAYQNFEAGKTYYAGIYYTGRSPMDCDVCLFESQTEFSDWYNARPTTTPTPDPVNGLKFKEPCISWNASVATVKSYMSGYTLQTDIRANSSGDGYYMQYEGKDSELMYEYDFTTRTTGLTDSYVVFDEEDVSIEDITSYFNNNPAYGTVTALTSLGIYMVSSTDEKTGVMIQHGETSGFGIWVVNYYDRSSYAVKQRIQHHFTMGKRAKSMAQTTKVKNFSSGKLLVPPHNKDLKK